MNILHVIQSLDPAAGGTAVVAARLAAAQARQGHHVTLLAQKLPADLAPIGNLSTAQVRQAPPLSLRQSMMSRTADAQLTAAMLEHDVVHMHGIWDLLLFAAAGAAHAKAKPYIITPHGMLDPWSLSQKRWKKWIALNLGWRSMLDRAAALHFLNDDERQLAARLKLVSPGFVIPNGIDPEVLEDHPSPTVFRKLVPALGDRPYILFLSRLHFKKGLDYLADAFHIVVQRGLDVDLVVAGPDDGALGAMEKRVAALGLVKRVHITGPIYGDAKLAALAGAACFCLPSRQEGFSVAILEALACGTPVVISENCHFPEVAQAGAGEIVPLEATAIATAISSILSDPRLGRQMGDAGRQLVADRFTWPRIAEQTTDLYSRFTRAGVGSSKA